MCGRTACNQCREVYQKAACYYDEKSKSFAQPEWKDSPNGGKKFEPSCNIAPTDITPVLVSGNMIPEAVSEQILHPMMWGLIPPWHKGSYKAHKLSTTNCRIEGVGSSKLYSPLLKDGKRCVVICDGFYEWRTASKDKTKQPYFIHSTQDSKVAVEDETCWAKAEWDSSTGWHGPKLLYMAGLYNVWQGDEGEIYSYTVLTKESKKDFSWIHHRTPAILPTEELVKVWLDTKTFDKYEALKALDSFEDNSLSLYPVSTYVNNATHKSKDCLKKIQLKKNTLLTSWIKKEPSVKRETESSNNEDPSHQIKKIKHEN